MVRLNGFSGDEREDDRRGKIVNPPESEEIFHEETPSSATDMKMQVSDATASIDRIEERVSRPNLRFPSQRYGITITAPTAITMPTGEASGLSPVTYE